jgi:hypothetical protein
VRVSDLHPPSLRCCHSAEGRAKENKTVVVITLSIVTVALLAALGYLASGARKLDLHLSSLLQGQRERRNEMANDVERLRQYYNRT